jgi:diguanylate cyclase (GGDEF)-like protein
VRPPPKILDELSTPMAIGATLVGIALIGWLDYATGVEIRLLPLYYLPLSVAAWKLGGRGAIGAAVLCAAAWMFTNALAGRHYSTSSIAALNFAMQATSFVIVGLLIASVRGSYRAADELSRTDSLTGLLNARAFKDEAGRVIAIARRHRHELTVAYIDLDDFKEVNDTMGHRRGDELLRATADMLRQTLRAGDVIARVGGDEFVVLLPETGPAGAEPLLERLRASLLASLSTERRAISASIGMMALADPSVTVEQLVQWADELMYTAKVTGKNRVVLSTRPWETKPPTGQPSAR